MKASLSSEPMKITKIEMPRFINIECSQSNVYMLRSNRRVLSALLRRCNKKLTKKDAVNYFYNFSQGNSCVRIVIIDRDERTSIHHIDDFDVWCEQKFK